MDKNQVRELADEIRRLSDCGGLLAKVAKAMIAVQGYYTYTDVTTGRKVFIEA